MSLAAALSQVRGSSAEDREPIVTRETKNNDATIAATFPLSILPSNMNPQDMPNPTETAWG